MFGQVNFKEAVKRFKGGGFKSTAPKSKPEPARALSVKEHKLLARVVAHYQYADEAGVTHLYFPGGRSGLVNRAAVKRSQTIILTESIIDALTVYDQGFKNTIPIYGVNGLLSEHLTLLQRKIKNAYLVWKMRGKC